MVSILHLVDMVLEDEGIAVDTRRNVARCILYGSPNPADAELRAEQQGQIQDVLKFASPTILLQMPEGVAVPDWGKR